MFGLKPKNPDENGVAEMEQLWREFERRILWSEQRREDARHPQDCTMSTCQHHFLPGVRSKLEEIHMWEDFSRVNFGNPLEDIQWI